MVPDNMALDKISVYEIAVEEKTLDMVFVDEMIYV